MAKLTDSLQNLLSGVLFGDEKSVGLFTDSSDAAPVSDEYLTALNLSVYEPARAKAVQKHENIEASEAKKNLPALSSGIAVIDLGGAGAHSRVERKPDIRLLRNYARHSVWVRAAVDYHRRMLGRARFELIPADSTEKPKRIDKFVRAEIESVLRRPNEAEESYNTLKEQIVEDYLVVGHGCFELDLFNDLTPRGIRVIDAARIGFVRAWDGTDRSVPRFVEFDDRHASRVKRFLAHEQVMCLVNRPQSETKLGLSHVEILHRAVIALLSGDEFLIKQIIQPTPSSVINLGEGVTKPQVDDFKYQLQQVRDALAVIGGAKNAQVLRLSASADEMRLLDGQAWFVRQVAAVFGISTAKLKLAVDTSRANTEAMYDDDLEMITGELTRIEELETATFINRYSYLGEINLQFFYPIMHRKDEQQQARIASLQTRQPWASPNEARMRTGEKPLDEKKFPFADEPTVQTKDGPVPMSLWTKQMQKLEKNLEIEPKEENQSAEEAEGGEKQ